MTVSATWYKAAAAKQGVHPPCDISSRNDNRRSVSLVVLTGVDIAAKREGSIQESLDAVACGVHAAVPDQGDSNLALHTLL